MTHRSNFDKYPAVEISPSESECSVGWGEVLERLRAHGHARRIAIECYPGVLLEPLRRHVVAELAPELVLESAEALLSPAKIENKFADMLGDDPVFGRLAQIELDAFFDPKKIARSRRLAENTRGRVIAIGAGATLVLPDYDLLIYVDVARWEIQQRQRRKEAPSLGLPNAAASPGQLYKRAFFLDWRAADQQTARTLHRT